ncbi:right-handed parallel beta-helix repeat-containing protein [Rhodobacteraceae bacterium 2CG4]|uniref:Right-handed parallel beta-helix repeat-containing protein n=1 Tax=Halovulum marinum TaxID=2662447 RepID=A0A6L5YW23_9RHOB|nr:glycosyl hydrolase family 28-related protein [Halovulum marinum]MSU88052.1 right-handed parallel beta-helix repeat-containing protein [Halovulum marinum]
MNKAITEGLNLMPPAFVDGLDVWSSGDGTPGTTAYDTDTAGTLYSADPDFGTCLELIKTTSPQRLRYMGETPILPGCYLEVSARVKWVSGPAPQVRIAGYAGNATGGRVGGVPEEATPITLTDPNRVYTVRAIVGSGQRTGVDLVWGINPVYGHFGIDLMGSNGAVIRVESISVEDRTSVFHRKLLDLVDVIDFGAKGDGITDDAAAFETADAAADGRVLVVPAGTYYLNKNVTLLSPVRFEGTVSMPEDKRLVLRANFDLPSYAEAFGDETLGLKKGLQALFNFSDHEAFDLGGRRVDLTEPIDVHKAVGNVNVMTNRRVLRNGALQAEDTGAWDPEVVTGTATYSPSEPLKLKGLTNIGAIKVGALVEGFGVGREVYVRARNETTGELTLSLPLARASASQSYTFTRYKYMLDFSGFNTIKRFSIESMQFFGAGRGCGVMLSDDGTWWGFRDCWFEQVEHGISSVGGACQGISIDQCEFQSGDSASPIPSRRSVAFNTNSNDAKIRNNRCINYRHFGVMSGSGNLILGNHFWQADLQAEGEKTAGIVLTDKRSKTTVTGNYFDTQFIEITNEHQADASNSGGEAFGRISIVGNIFTATEVPAWFSFIKLTPLGNGHRLDGFNVFGNTFQLFGGSQIDRADQLDTSLGSIDHSRTVDVVWDGNSYAFVSTKTQSPALILADQSSASSSWAVNTGGKLPFGGRALGVDGVVPHGQVVTSGGGAHHDMPWVETEQGSQKDRVDLRWSTSVRGKVQVRVRVDQPS